MTMIIVLKRPDCIIMTADKRITTTTRITGEQITHDNYQKIKCIDEKYFVSFAGRLFLAEEALNYVEQNLERINDNEPELLFKEAFNYGKDMFETVYIDEAPTTVFFLGYVQSNVFTLLAFSSDNNFEPQEITYTIQANNNGEDQNVIREAESFIDTEIDRQGVNNLPHIFFQAIERTNDEMIGNTGDSVVIMRDTIVQLTHP